MQIWLWQERQEQLWVRLPVLSVPLFTTTAACVVLFGKPVEIL
jgi:hypothetical protein